MSTFNSIPARKQILLSVLSAFAISAQAAGASTVADTQTKVAAVLQGTRTELELGTARTDVSSRTVDVQEAAQRILLGINRSTGDSDPRSATARNRPSVGSNGQSSGDAQKLTQAVVLGRAAS